MNPGAVRNPHRAPGAARQRPEETPGVEDLTHLRKPDAAVQEVLHKEARLARFDRARGGDRPETTYVELPTEYVVALVTLPESFAGMTLRDLGARQRFGVNVIEVKRRIGGKERRIIPEPGMDLKPGDSLIVVGRPTDIAHLGDPARLAEIAASIRPTEPVTGPPGG